MNQSLFQQYYEIRHQQDTLAIQEAKLKEQLIAELKQSNESTIKTEFGNFTKRITKRYVFTPAVQEKEAEVKKLIDDFARPLVKQIDDFAQPLKNLVETTKKAEIESGLATEEQTVGMAFSYADHSEKEAK